MTRNKQINNIVKDNNRTQKRVGKNFAKYTQSNLSQVERKKRIILFLSEQVCFIENILLSWGIKMGFNLL